MVFANLLEKGGIYRGLKGSTIKEVMENMIKTLPVKLHSVPADVLIKAVLEREALMSTGIGNGIALPHPRNPLIQNEENQFVAIGYLENKVNWNALDGQFTEIIILVLTSAAKTHLRVLSEISYFNRQAEFVKLLKEHSSMKELQNYIRETEKTWN